MTIRRSVPPAILSCAVLWGGILSIGLSCMPAAASDWREAARHPAATLGQPLAFDGAFCGGGGPDGKEPGLTQCSLGRGALLLESRIIQPSRPAARRLASCGGLDVWEQSPFCRFTIRLIPTRVGSAPGEGARRVPLLGTDKLKMR